MANKDMLDTDLRSARLPTHWIADRQKVVGKFLPLTPEEVDQKFGVNRVPEDGSIRWGGPVFNGWRTSYHMEELLILVQAKFNHAVDIYPVQLGIVSRDGEPVHTWDTWAIRPKRSELCTAVVWYNYEKIRYETLSLRISRARRLVSAYCSEVEEWLISSNKDANKMASIIAALRPYSIKEVCDYAVYRMHNDIHRMPSKLNREEATLQQQFYDDDLSNKKVQEELLAALDAAKAGQPITFAPESETMNRYDTFLTKMNELKQKQNYLGARDCMYLVRSFVTGNVVCAYRGDSSYDPKHTVTYKSFDSVPIEIKRAVMALESIERNANNGVAEDLGVVPKPHVALCREACGFLISTDFINEFCKLDAGVVHG